MVTKEAKIYIAGHRGMVGSAVWRVLESKGYSNLIGKASAEHDLASLVKDMMLSDVKLMQKQQYLKKDGYHTNNRID